MAGVMLGLGTAMSGQGWNIGNGRENTGGEGWNVDSKGWNAGMERLNVKLSL